MLYIVIAQTLVIGGLIFVVLRQEIRQDNTDEIIGQRGAIRDAQRAEDEERERLRLCELILVLPPDFPTRGDLLGQLACPPDGDPSYDQAPDVPTTAPGAAPTAAATVAPASTVPSAAPATTTTPATLTPPATATPPTTTSVATPTTTPTTTTGVDPGDPGLPGQLCVPLLGCLQL